MHPQSTPARVCAQCGETFVSKKRKKSQRFCSKSCAARSRGASAQSTCFARGQTPWNKGKQNWRAGYRHSDETKCRMSEALKRDQATCVTPEHYRIRRSTEYRLWRKAVFERDNYTCQMCGARSVAGKRVRLEADHILPFAFYPDKRFDLDNGRTLCESCHKQTPTYGSGAWNFTGQEARRG